MKKVITPYLLGFAATAAILTIVFWSLMTYGLEHEQYVLTMVIIPVLYFFGMGVSGMYFGKKDVNYLPINDVGFRFHLTTYLVYNVITEIWAFSGITEGRLSTSTAHRTVIIWGFFLLVHFIFFLWAKKKSINGLNKHELFD